MTEPTDQVVRPHSLDGHDYTIIRFEGSDRRGWNGIHLWIDGNDAAKFERTDLILLQRVITEELERG
jgi:hypothetical protein